MVTRTSPIPSLALALFLAAAVPGWAQLASKSPFLPAQGAGAAPAASAPLEFRGYMVTGGETLYCVHHPGKKASVWLKANERSPEFEVTIKQHDASKDTLTVEFQGRTLTLAERVSKVVSGGAPSVGMPPPVVNPTPNVAPAVTQSVVLNPTPADEQRRLDAVAAEVARRRALREQAVQQNASPAPAGTQPQPGPARMPGVTPPANAPAPMNANDPRGRGPNPPRSQ